MKCSLQVAKFSMYVCVLVGSVFQDGAARYTSRTFSAMSRVARQSGAARYTSHTFSGHEPCG